jgi:hypothetical protein
VVRPDIHGFVDEVPWDYHPIPQRIWDQLKALPNGCWAAPTIRKARWYQRTIVQRISHRNPYDALAITPTCANQRCCNPAHLCVVWANPLSSED